MIVADVLCPEPTTCPPRMRAASATSHLRGDLVDLPLSVLLQTLAYAGRTATVVRWRFVPATSMADRGDRSLPDHPPASARPPSRVALDRAPTRRVSAVTCMEPRPS